MISVAHLVANTVFHTRTKLIELDLHFVGDKVLHNQLAFVLFLPHIK